VSIHRPALRSQPTRARELLQHTASHCITHTDTATHLQHTCNTLQNTATQLLDEYTSSCPPLSAHARERALLQHTATHCNSLQHTATHCNTLHHTHTATQLLDEYTSVCPPLSARARERATATHCNTLHHTVTHCSTLQHTCNTLTLQHSSTHCITL